MGNNGNSTAKKNSLEQLREAVRNITTEEIRLFQNSKKKAPGIPVEDLLDGFVGRIGDRISSAVDGITGLSKKHQKEVEDVVKETYEEIKKKLNFRHFDFNDLKELYEKKRARPLIPLRNSYSKALEEVARELLSSKEYKNLQSQLYALRGKGIRDAELGKLRDSFRSFFAFLANAAKERGVKLPQPYQRIRAIAMGMLMSNLGISEDEAKKFFDSRLFPISKGVRPIVSPEHIDAILPDELESSPKMDQSYVAVVEAGLDSDAEFEGTLRAITAFYNLGMPISFISDHDLRSQKVKSHLRNILLHERVPYAHMKAPTEDHIEALEKTLLSAVESHLTDEKRKLIRNVGNALENYVYGQVEGSLGLKASFAKKAYLKPPIVFDKNPTSKEVLPKVYGALSELLFISRLLHVVSERLNSHISKAKDSVIDSQKQLLNAEDLDSLFRSRDIVNKATRNYVGLSCSHTVTAFIKGKTSLQALGAMITYFLALETHGVLNYGSLPMAAQVMAARAISSRKHLQDEQLREKYDEMLKKFVVNYQKVAPRNPSAASAFNILQQRVGNDASMHKKYLNNKKKR